MTVAPPRPDTPVNHQQDKAEHRPQRMTLRARVTWLTAMCVAVAVAVVSLGA